MNVLVNNKTFFYELRRISGFEKLANNTRTPSIANTYQNQPEFQKAENRSRNYARKYQQAFDDPFKYRERMMDRFVDGNNVWILKSVMQNGRKDTPDVITINKLRTIDYY